MRLPKKYRIPLYLYHYEGYSIKEVGGTAQAQPIHGQNQTGQSSREAEITIGGG